MVAIARRIQTRGNGSVLGWGAGLLGSTTTPRYLYPWYSEKTAEVGELSLVVPRPGRLRGFRVRHNIPDGNGGTIVYTIVVEGVVSPVSISLPSTGLIGSDLINDITVAEGDRISVLVTKAINVGNSPRSIVATADLV